MTHPPHRRRARRWALPAGLFLGAVLVFAAALVLRPTPPTPSVGLAALSAAHDLATPRGIAGEDFWQLALTDFDRSLDGAADLRRAWVPTHVPERWRSGRWLSYGMLQRHRRQYPAARRAFERALSIEPRWALARVQLARVLLKLGDDPGALAAAQQACLDDPAWPAGQLALAHVLEARLAADDRKGWDRVQSVVRRALALAGDRRRERAYVLADLAQVLHVSGNESAAAEAAREALAIRADLLAAHLVLAEQALAREDGAAAERHGEQAESLDARDARVELALAEALLLQGDTAGALERYRYAVLLEHEDGYTGADPTWMRAVQEAIRAGRVPERFFSVPPSAVPSRSSQPAQ